MPDPQRITPAMILLSGVHRLRYCTDHTRSRTIPRLTNPDLGPVTSFGASGYPTLTDWKTFRQICYATVTKVAWRELTLRNRNLRLLLD
jgi:hypothetical protein